MKMAAYTNSEGIYFKVGDFITSYHKGIHKLMEIQPRGKEANHVPIFAYAAVLTSDYKPVKRKALNECDAGYCRIVDVKMLEKERDEFVDRINNAIKIVKS